MASRINAHRGAARLKKIDLFSTCNRRELARVSSLCSATSREKGATLTEQGTLGSQFFVIVEGEATAWRSGCKMATLGSGSFFGEMALLDRSVRTATVVAETDISLLVLSQREFNVLTDVAPTVAKRMMTELSGRLRQADEWIADDSASDRLRVP